MRTILLALVATFGLLTAAPVFADGGDYVVTNQQVADGGDYVGNTPGAAA
jgi:hypothetical protein